MTRFETYVHERVSELLAPKRARLEAELKAEEDKVTALRDKYLETVEAGVEALVSKVAERAKKDGCLVRDVEEPKDELSAYTKTRIVSALGLERRFDYKSRESLWPEGTPARRAQDALAEFDALCDREARRLVVYKMDLGMKPEKFETMLAEVAEKLDK